MVALAGALTACGGDGSDSAPEPDEGSQVSVDGVVTVTGTLDGMTLDEGVCMWLETSNGRVEVWGGDDVGLYPSFLPDDSFEGVLQTDPTVGGVGPIVFVPGDRVIVTGTTYEAEPGCGDYGVDATEPWTAK
jgi:hypothetical protein